MGIQAKVEVKDFTKDAEKKAFKFLSEIVKEAAAEALVYTPKEYGTLARSQYTNVYKTKNGIFGVVGYGASYADELNGDANNKPNWHPESTREKEGPLSNMKATPRFLNKGFESSKSRSKFASLEKILGF